jgi:hypothetical protein
MDLSKSLHIKYFLISNLYTSRNENSYEIYVLKIIFFCGLIQNLKLSTRMLIKSWKHYRKPYFLNTWSLANGLLRSTEQDASSYFIWAFNVVIADAKEPYADTTIQTGTSDGHLSAILLPEAYQRLCLPRPSTCSLHLQFTVGISHTSRKTH